MQQIKMNQIKISVREIGGYPLIAIISEPGTWYGVGFDGGSQ